MWIELCPWGSGKYLLWQPKGRHSRDRLAGEFNTRKEAEDMENLTGEIERLIANYRERIEKYEALALRQILRMDGGPSEASVRAGVLVSVIDDLKRLAGIA